MARLADTTVASSIKAGVLSAASEGRFGRIGGFLAAELLSLKRSMLALSRCVSVASSMWVRTMTATYTCHYNTYYTGCGSGFNR